MDFRRPLPEIRWQSCLSPVSSVGVAASTAPLNSPGQIGISPAGDLFIADTGNHRVRKIGVNGIISTVAGTGTLGRWRAGRIRATVVAVGSGRG